MQKSESKKSEKDESEAKDEDKKEEEGEEKEEEDGKQEEAEKHSSFIKEKAEARRTEDLNKLAMLYSESSIIRLLRLVEIFTSIATCSSHPLSMV